MKNAYILQCKSHIPKCIINNIKNVIIISVVTTIIMLIYGRELIIMNLSSSKDFIYITTKDRNNDPTLLNEVQTLTRKKDIFVRLESIQRSVKNIFFVESRCGLETLKKHFSGRETLDLNARQVCAVESTALTNPEHDIYILYTCPLAENFFKLLPNLTKHLIKYPNIFIVEINSPEIFMNTPVQSLYESKKLESSSYPIEHFSDIVRFLLLWKFGGTYLDLDVVTIRSLLELGTNYAGVEDSTTINGAVLNIEPYGTGHDLMQKVLEYVNEHFDGTGWITNGPAVLTKLIADECDLKYDKMDEGIHKCDKFHILPPHYFYKIHWSNESEFFNATLGPEIMETLKNVSYVVHMWNKLSHGHKITVGSTQAYSLLANEFCPNVINNCGEEF